MNMQAFHLVVILVMSFFFSINTFAEKPMWKLEKLDLGGEGGRKTTLRIGKDQMLHIVYTGCVENNCKENSLKYAHKAPHSNWIFSTIDDSDGDVGWWPSIEIDDGNRPHILYTNHYRETLNYAYLNKRERWETKKISEGRGGWWIATRYSNGYIYVAHTKLASSGWNETMLQVGTLRVSEPLAWNFEDVDRTWNSGWTNAMALDPKGNPVVVHTQGAYPNGSLKLAYKDDKGWTTLGLDESVNKMDVAVDQQGFFHTIYNRVDFTNSGPQNGVVTDLVYATNAPGGEWKIEVIDAGNPPDTDTGYHPQIAIDSKGGLHIVYRDYSNRRLIYGRNLNGKWDFALLDGFGSSGLYSSLAIDSNDVLHISYINASELYYGKCEGCARR